MGEKPLRSRTREPCAFAAMSYLHFANLLSVVSGFVAGVYFCLGSASLTSRTIHNLAGTYWNENPHLARFLTATKAEYLCGGLGLCFTFALQFAALVSALPGGAIFGSFAVGAASALIAGIVLFTALWLLRGRLIRRLSLALAQEPHVP
jgi:uncharacterized membrane protein (GlpM family)